jgi:predicted ATPase
VSLQHKSCPRITKADIVFLQTGDANRSEILLQQAMKESHKQGALSSELAAATSLARILARTGESDRAIDLLVPLCERYTEGRQLYPMTDARSVLGVLDVVIA